MNLQRYVTLSSSYSSVTTCNDTGQTSCILYDPLFVLYVALGLDYVPGRIHPQIILCRRRSIEGNRRGASDLDAHLYALLLPPIFVLNNLHIRRYGRSRRA